VLEGAALDLVGRAGAEHSGLAAQDLHIEAVARRKARGGPREILRCAQDDRKGTQHDRMGVGDDREAVTECASNAD
jgi:hypothetical protein